MIKAETDGKSLQCRASGDPMRLAAEVALIVSALYENYTRAGCLMEASAFRIAVITALTAPGSPAWKSGPGKGEDGVFICAPDLRGGKEGGHAES